MHFSYTTFNKHSHIGIPVLTWIWPFVIQGTRNIIEGCIKQSVPYLVYTSTVDVVVGANDIDILKGDESIAKPKNLLFKGYGETKGKAEDLIIEANGRQLARGMWSYDLVY